MIDKIALITCLLIGIGLGWYAGTYNYKMLKDMTCKFEIKPMHRSELE